MFFLRQVIMQSLLFIECKNLILMKIVPSHRSSAACEFLMHWMWMRVKRFIHEIFWKIGFKFYLATRTKQIFVNVSKFYSAIHRPFKPNSLCILKGLVKSIIHPIVKLYKSLPNYVRSVIYQLRTRDKYSSVIQIVAFNNDPLTSSKWQQLLRYFMFAKQ